jgi:hypothetical protein
MRRVLIHAALDKYVEKLVTEVRELLQRRCVAVYAGGSAALGDYHHGSSDLDIVLLTSHPLDRLTKARVVEQLSHSALPCPAKGLDLLVYAEGNLRTPDRAPFLEMSLSTGAEWDEEAEYGGPYAAGLIDLAVVRNDGVALLGPEANRFIGEIPRIWLLEELRKVVIWHRDHVHNPVHDPLGVNAVLNCARAWRFAVEGILGSKSAGARWLLGRGRYSILLSALEARSIGTRLPKPTVLALLEETLEALPTGS